MNQGCHSCALAESSQYIRGNITSNNLDLQQEIESLRSKLRHSNSHIGQLEIRYAEEQKESEAEINKLNDELLKLRDRYDRLLESHKKLQRVNHNLEDKLLKVVNRAESEKITLQKEVASLTSQLVDSKVTVSDLQEENERYRSDCNLASRLLQNKPSAYVDHKLNSLPLDLQERVKNHLSREEIVQLEDACIQETASESNKTIRVPMPTFPPTAMVYSVNSPADQVNFLENSASEAAMTTVPTSVIAKVLTHPASKHRPRRIFLCNHCKSDSFRIDKFTQTERTSSRMLDCSPAVHKLRKDSIETEI